MQSQEMKQKICMPPLIAEHDPYRIKFAVTGDETNAALRLRYLVFKQEQGHHVKNNDSASIDTDDFDQFCLHLIVENTETREVVGTTRILPGPAALENQLGFYSSQEFVICGLEKFAPQMVEIGRSCVAMHYRNGTVLSLIWTGVSDVMRRSGLRYLMGCVSLEETDPRAGWVLYDFFREQNKLCVEIQGTPLKKVKMERPAEEELRAFREQCPMIRKLIPPLFKGYLHMGAQICSEPVFDREFGTIDFLVLVDTGKLPERYMKHFNVPEVK